MSLLIKAALNVRELTDHERTALPLLVASAEKFLRLGSPTLAEYVELEPAELVAFALAAETIAAERAVQIGVAAQSPLGAASVLAPVDGGKAGARLVARAGLEALLSG